MTEQHIRQREHWSSRVGFILAAAGSAIGLGSLWRFPYVTGDNGGGAFVLLFLIFLIFLGIPVFIAELVIGRHAQKSAVTAYSELSKRSSNWKLLGWLNLFSCFIILSFYSVVAGWCLNYALMSLNQFTVGKTPDQIRLIFDIVYSSPSLNLFWLFIFMLINVGVVFSGVRKGIEHWSKILMPALFIILIGLFCYSTTLPGFGEAAKFILYPDFSRLTPTGVLNALGLAFFTLSVGLGIILTYGSYMKSDQDITKNTLFVAGTTLFVSLIAALMIFPIVFTFNFPAQGGPGLVFKTMPVLFAQLPASLIISTVFFLLLVFSALTSTISLLEMISANLMELRNWGRSKAVLIGASIAFVLGIPSALAGTDVLFPNWKAIYGKNFFDTMNDLTSNWFMPIAGIFITVFVGWVMDKKIIKNEFFKRYYIWKIFPHLVFLHKVDRASRSIYYSDPKCRPY